MAGLSHRSPTLFLEGKARGGCPVPQRTCRFAPGLWRGKPRNPLLGRPAPGYLPCA